MEFKPNLAGGNGAVDIDTYRRLSSATIDSSFQVQKQATDGGQVYVRVNERGLANNAFQAGYGALARGDGSVAVGPAADAREDSSVAIGSYPVAAGPSSIAVGDQVQALHAYTLCVGAGAVSDRTQQAVFGGPPGYFSDWVTITGINGQGIRMTTTTQLVTIAAAATTDSTVVIPLDAVVYYVSARVVTVIPTAATFTVTGAASGTQFDVAGGVAVAANTTDAGTRNCPFKNGAAQAIRFTPNLVPATATGQVRVTAAYYQAIVATS